MASGRVVRVGVAVTAALLGCGLLGACGGGSSDAGSKTTATGPSAGATAAPSAGTAGAATPTAGATGSTASAGSTAAHGGVPNPCGLLTAAQGQAILHKPLGAGRTVGSGDLSECAYDSGPLVIALFKSPDTKSALAKLVGTGDAGGKVTEIHGLGDDAIAYGSTGIVEVLKGTTVVSVTSSSTKTSEAVARAVLPRLS